MSERGSFVTEFIQCQKCFDAAKSCLEGFHPLGEDDWFEGYVLADEKIIAGRLKSLASQMEVKSFKDECAYELPYKICHPLRIVAIGDTCSNPDDDVVDSFVIQPIKKTKNKED